MSSVLSPTDMASSSSSASSFAPDNSSKIIPCLPGSPMRWFFPLEKLHADNPSLRSGIDLDKELSYRQQAASFIYDLGSRLQLPHWVMNVAIVYMHRFYVFHSFKRFYRNDLAAAALFLAAKVEEMPRKLEHIVKISYALHHRDEPALDSMSDKYFEEAQKIAIYENILLQTLGFDLTVEVPNTFVVKRVQAFNAPRSLAFAAYHFTTDCLHLTTFCLRYRPSVIACACIFLACDWAKWEIPATRDGKPWYLHLDPEVTPELLRALADELVSVFQQCPDRIRNKRHLASIKRDSNGVVTPASIMADRNNGVSLADLHDSVSSSHSMVPPTLPAISFPPTAAAMVRVDVKTSEKQICIGTTADGGKLASFWGPAASAAMMVANGSETSTTSSLAKKARPQTSKVDLKSYKERRERELEKPKKGADSSQQAPVRKSFIPDMSSMEKESWLFTASDKDDVTSDSKTVIKKEATTQPGSGHRESSIKGRRHDRCDEDRSSRHDDHRRHHHQYSHHSRAYRDEKSKADRSSTELSISLREDRHLDKPGSGGLEAAGSTSTSPSTSSRRHRSQEQPNPPSDLAAESASQERPSSRIGHHSSSSNDHQGPTVVIPGKKRRHDDVMENGVSEALEKKTARVIDYEHGARNVKTVIDYECGGRIVTDYGHGSAAATHQTHCVGDNQFGYSETKALSSVAVSTFSPSALLSANSSCSKEEKDELDANEKLRSASRHEKVDQSSSRHTDGREQQCPKGTKLGKAKAVGCPQAAAIERHFQHLRQGFIAKVPDSSNGYSTSNKTDVSWIIGKHIPDDILRQATEKAGQLQSLERSEKLERLEKLKNTNFAALPLLSLRVPKPPSMSTDGD